MTARTALLALIFLAGCASSPSPPPSATPAAAPPPDTASSSEPPPGGAAAASPAASSRPSDWALTIVGTPFVFAFRVAVCAATAVVAGPTAALFAVSDDPRGGFAYLSDGLAQNCGPPYAIPVPVAADRAREPALGQPRPLTRYSSATVMSR